MAPLQSRLGLFRLGLFRVGCEYSESAGTVGVGRTMSKNDDLLRRSPIPREVDGLLINRVSDGDRDSS